MLISLNQTYETTDAKVIEKWIQGQGSEELVSLLNDESERVKKRVLLTVQEAEEGKEESDSEEPKEDLEGSEKEESVE